MKRLLTTGFFLLALAHLAVGQPAPVWFNTGTTNCPPSSVPQIDATNVINQGQLNISLPITFVNGGFGFQLTPQPYTFYDVLSFTNRGLFTCDTGFVFDNTPGSTSTNFGGSQRAQSFGNGNPGIITGSGELFLVNGGIIVAEETSLSISATNVVNSGLMQVPTFGVISVDGEKVNLRNGTMLCQGVFSVGTNAATILGTIFGSLFGTQISDSYWGLGMQTNDIQNASFALPNPFSPVHTITNSFYQQIKFWQIDPQNAIGSANVFQVNASNITTQIVIVGNTNSGITTAVHYAFSGGGFAVPIVQWQSIVTNYLGVVTTNVLYLSDTFGALTNFQLYTNDNALQTQIPLLSPTNYFGLGTFDNFGFAFSPTGNTAYNPLLIPSGGVTNQFAAFGVILSPETFPPDPGLPGQNVTNIPGRVEITADTSLDLTGATINGPNYLRLTASNHFVGSAGASITSPNLDINVGTTNGFLAITNLVASSIPELIGTVDGYSARWTNIVNGVTNSYHILMVDSRLATFAPPKIQNFSARSTNVVVSDQLNVSSNLLINATTLTITSNDPGSPTGYGQINLQSPNLLWSSSLPALQYVTNYGLIASPNATFFALIAELPYFTTNYTSNYQTFVNHGSVVTSGNTTWASYFENSGATNLIITNNPGLAPTTNLALVYSTFGPISIIASNALLENGAFITFPTGDINFNTTNLVVSNHYLLAAGALTLTVTNNLTDDGNTSNFWSVTDGVNLAIKPLTGDLLGTTITNFAALGQEVDNLWAGQDRGATPAGFLNNGAVGHMILDGGNTVPGTTGKPQFHFLGPDGTNAYAIYVDLLELRDGATNTATVNHSPVFSTLDIDTNVTIYFAGAVLGTNDISEKLSGHNGYNGAAGGQLVWVPSYAGIFSGTNIVDLAGITNRFNRALAISPDIDSDGDGSVNASDNTPFYTSSSVNMTLAFTNLPPRTPALTWFALANATNYLYHGNTPNFAATASNLVSITKSNFLSSTNGVVFTTNGGVILPIPSRNVTVLDRGRTNNTGFYKVQVNSIQP